MAHSDTTRPNIVVGVAAGLDETSATQQTPPTRFLSDREIADRYDISESTLLRWRRDGRYPKAISLVPGGPNRTSLDIILRHEAGRSAAAETEAPPATSIQPGHPYYGFDPRSRNATPQGSRSARSGRNESRSAARRSRRVLEDTDA
jgi:hypothetical protein